MRRLLLTGLLIVLTFVQSTHGIIRGQMVDNADYPFFVVIFYSLDPNDDGMYSFDKEYWSCAGVIIDVDKVATSMGCLSVDADMYTVPQRKFYVIHTGNFSLVETGPFDKEVLMRKIANSHYDWSTAYKLIASWEPKDLANERTYERTDSYFLWANSYAVLESYIHKENINERILRPCAPKLYRLPTYYRTLYFLGIGHVYTGPASGVVKREVKEVEGKNCKLDYFWPPYTTKEEKENISTARYEQMRDELILDTWVCTEPAAICINDQGAPLILEYGPNTEDKCLYAIGTYGIVDESFDYTKVDLSKRCSNYMQDCSIVPHIYEQCTNKMQWKSWRIGKDWLK